MELNVKNLSRTLLTQDIGLTETSFEVADAGALPDPPFLITVEGEIMRVGSKNISTNTLSNVLRGREGTSPAPHSSGTVVENRFTAGTYDEIKQTVTSCNDALTSHLADYASKQFGNVRYASTKNMIYYIDAVNGNDNNNGLSVATAFKTWAKMESMIPLFVMHQYSIRIIGNLLDEELTLNNRIISNSIAIRGLDEDRTKQQINSIKITAVLGNLNFNYLTVNNGVTANQCIGYKITNSVILNEGGAGAWNEDSIGAIRNCDFGDNMCQDCIRVEKGLVYSDNNTGVATRYGLSANGGGVIAKRYNYSQPTGGVADEFVSNGGEIR